MFEPMKSREIIFSNEVRAMSDRSVIWKNWSGWEEKTEIRYLHMMSFESPEMKDFYSAWES